MEHWRIPGGTRRLRAYALDARLQNLDTALDSLDLQDFNAMYGEFDHPSMLGHIAQYREVLWEGIYYGVRYGPIDLVSGGLEWLLESQPRTSSSMPGTPGEGSNPPAYSVQYLV